MKRIVLATFGSLGDIHPFLVLGNVLAANGYEVVVATHEHHGERVRQAGLGHAAVRPGLEEIGSEEQWTRKLLHPKKGPEILFREILLPWIGASYEDLSAACEGASLVIGHTLQFAAPIVCEKRGLPFLGAVLQPQLLFSARDSSVLPQFPWLESLRPLGPWPYRILHGAMLEFIRPWFEPVERLREHVGLPRSHAHPLVAAHVRRNGPLCLFSPHFASRQKDWPPGSVSVGFGFHEEPNLLLSEPTERFLAVGEAPFVFTLGSSAIHAAGDFFDVAAGLASGAGRARVLLVVGKKQYEETASRLSRAGLSPLQVSAYEPFSRLFPRARAVVHSAGIGTTAQCLRAGIRQVCVPFANDQGDNAARVERLGVGVRLTRARYGAVALRKALMDVENDDEMLGRAKTLAKKMAAEDFPAAVLAAVRRALEQA